MPDREGFALPADFIPGRPLPLVQVPFSLIDDPEVDALGVAVYAAIGRLLLAGRRAVSRAEIAESAGCSENTIRRRCMTLEERGWIEQVPSDGARNRYALNGSRVPLPEREGSPPREGGVIGSPSPESSSPSPSHSPIPSSLSPSPSAARGPALNGDLFAENGTDPVALAVGEFCRITGAEWRLTTPIDEWSRDIRREPKYAGVDFRYEIMRCAEWHDGKGKTPRAPDISIRNWLERAAEDAREDAVEGEYPAWIDDLPDFDDG